MEIKAQLNYLRMSPRKVRLAANLIKGMNTERAELELAHLPKRASLPILKLLRSALANARHNFQINEKELYVKNILVNEGPMFKRFMPRAFGRAAMIRKRSSHISLVLDTVGKVESRAPRTKGGPAVRELEERDLREETELKRRGGEAEDKKPMRGKSADFVRRVFRRKAI